MSHPTQFAAAAFCSLNWDAGKIQPRPGIATDPGWHIGSVAIGHRCFVSRLRLRSKSGAPVLLRLNSRR